MMTQLSTYSGLPSFSIIRGRRHLFDIAAALDAGHYVAIGDELCLAHTDAMNLTIRLALLLNGDPDTDILRIYLDHGSLAIPDTLLHAYWTIEVSTPTRRLTAYPARGGWFVFLPEGALRSLALSYTRRGQQGPDQFDQQHDDADDGWTIPRAPHLAAGPSEAVAADSAVHGDADGPSA